ncbi:MAG: TIGR02281 family clan AA aspartic protease [Sphingomonadaceae bacterium]
MTSDQTAGFIYGLLCLVIVGSSLAVRRLPMGQMAKYALAWVAIFAGMMLAFSFRDEAAALWQRVTASFSPQKPRVSGEEVRINRGDDGHFSIETMINGKPTVLLIDTGATVTTLSRTVAEAAGVDIDTVGFGVIVDTANGQMTMRRARARSISIGPIKRENQPVWVSEDDNLNVLGMSFLSSLGSWRVEGKTMVLVP